MMIIETRLGSREKEVLSVLNEYGALSGGGLRQMLNTEIGIRRLQQVLKKLAGKKLVKKFHDLQFGGHGTYYAVERAHRHIKAGAPRNLAHLEACSLWMRRLQRIFPDATIIRDRQFKNNPDAKHALLWDGIDREVIPDLLLFQKASIESRQVSIAIEIEQHHKAESRIIRKLTRYARGTNLDGVIYISPNNEIPNRVRSIFENKIVSRSDRINGYGDYFMLFSGEQKTVTDLFQPKNLFLESINVAQWLEAMKEKSIYDRRNQDFAKYSLVRSVS